MGGIAASTPTVFEKRIIVTNLYTSCYKYTYCTLYNIYLSLRQRSIIVHRTISIFPYAGGIPLL
jgi:hypothetical protein